MGQRIISSSEEPASATGSITFFAGLNLFQIYSGLIYGYLPIPFILLVNCMWMIESILGDHRTVVYTIKCWPHIKNWV